MKRRFKIQNETFELEVENRGAEVQAQMDDATFNARIASVEGGRYLVDVDGHTQKAFAIRIKDDVFLKIGGRHWTFKDITFQEYGGDGLSGGAAENVCAPMPGSVIKILVAEGDAVKANQSLAIVEAMKMENEVKAPADAVIGKILVQPGQQVGAGEILIEFVVPAANEEPEA